MQCIAKRLRPTHTCSTMAYRKTCKKVMGQSPFWLVYGMEFVIPMEYIVPSLCIEMLTGMMDHEALAKGITQLEELEEEQF